MTEEEMAEEFKDEIDAVVGIGNNEDIIDKVNDKAIELAKNGMQVIALAVNATVGI